MWNTDYAHPDIDNANFKCIEPLNSTEPLTCEFIVEFLLFGYKRPRIAHFGMRYVTRYQNQGNRPKASQKHKTKQISSIVCNLLVSTYVVCERLSVMHEPAGVVENLDQILQFTPILQYRIPPPSPENENCQKSWHFDFSVAEYPPPN